jgi:ABC-2 type transport system permease protein
MSSTPRLAIRDPMRALSAIHGIVARDLTRTTRQTSRLLGGVVRPFMWLVLVGTGYNAIARIEGGLSYQAFVYPGIIVMAALFGAMLTAISTVYDREFGMLRLMLASPAGTPAVLGLLLAARLRSVENFAGVINVVLFPLLFVSGALYPTASMPAVLRVLARVNPVTYQVDLMRHAFGQPAEFGVPLDVAVLVSATLVLFGLACLLFDPEQRFIGSTALRTRGAA